MTYKFTAVEVRKAAMSHPIPRPVCQWAGRVWARSTDPVQFISPDAYVLFLLLIAEAVAGVNQPDGAQR